jgi:N-acetylglucosamine kinase-like BadF-type ATPase
MLLQAVLEFWRLTSLDQLVEYANSTPAPDFSRLAEIVLACALRGDEVASSVLQQQGEDLAFLVKLVIRRLQCASGKHGWVPPVAFAGSILEKIPPLRMPLIESIQLEFPHARTMDGVVDPLLGALWHARTGFL